MDLIVVLRKQYRMTGVRISNQLQLPRSSVAAVLKREGLSQRKHLDPPQVVRQYEHARPGEMVPMDIKKLARFWRAGHRVTGNRKQDSRGAGWEYVHVCVDDYSRLAYAEVCPNQRQQSATAFLKRALDWFARFGIRVQRVLTDNGPCYRSKLFLKCCRHLRLRNCFTRPYRPQTNGKAERFIQTLLGEWAYARTYGTSLERHSVLPLYLIHYNHHRQHASLHYKPPITRAPTVNNVTGIHS